ncbi:MAG: hypothetical protein AAB341_00380 [Planctomycetota bacterium]
MRFDKGGGEAAGTSLCVAFGDAVKLVERVDDRTIVQSIEQAVHFIAAQLLLLFGKTMVGDAVGQRLQDFCATIDWFGIVSVHCALCKGPDYNRTYGVRSAFQ